MNKKLLGSLTYSAIGDAMGSATENLSFQQIRELFGGKVTTLLKPGDTAFALGNEAGQVTDDFSQTYLMCLEIIKENGEISLDGMKRALISWSNMPHYFNRFAGPTTRSAIEMYKSGSETIKPLEGAVTIDYSSKATNGAAMKISPAGFMNPGDFEGAIRDALTISQSTHDNHLAVSGAISVAVAISEAMTDHATFESVVEAGLYGAIKGEEIGKAVSRTVGGASVVERMKLALQIADEKTSKEERLEKMYNLVGAGLHISEAVPSAFGIIKMNSGEPLEAVIDAVNIGYDTDTIAMIVGSIVGCLAEEDSSVDEMLDKIEKVNDMQIREVADALSKFL